MTEELVILDHILLQLILSNQFYQPCFLGDYLLLYVCFLLVGLADLPKDHPKARVDLVGHLHLALQLLLQSRLCVVGQFHLDSVVELTGDFLSQKQITVMIKLLYGHSVFSLLIEVFVSVEEHQLLISRVDFSLQYEPQLFKLIVDFEYQICKPLTISPC